MELVKAHVDYPKSFDETFMEGVIDMSKNFIDAVKSIRNMWHMNPVTRIHDKNKKDKKKQRREGKEICRKYGDE